MCVQRGCDIVLSDVVDDLAGFVKEEFDLVFGRDFLVPQILQMGIGFTRAAVLDKVVDVRDGFVDTMIAQALNELLVEFRGYVFDVTRQCGHGSFLQGVKGKQ